MATLSIDLRQRILKTYDAGEVTRQEVADRYQVSLGMVKKLLQQRRKTGDISPRHCNSGRHAKITADHQRKLRGLVDTNPDMTLEELRDAIAVSCTLQAVHYALGRMKISLKKRRCSLPN